MFLELFQKLFRQDLLVASILRNFLLAERVMRSLHCTPVCVPRLPPTFSHFLWEAWDLTVDSVLSQLPQLIADPQNESIYQVYFLLIFSFNFSSTAISFPTNLL